MSDRIIDISEHGARIRIDSGRLLIEREGGAVPVALEDIGTLVLANPSINITQPALAAIAEAGGAVLVCDGKRLPIGMFLPLVGHTTQRERIAAQIAASLPLRKRLWQGIIVAKIRNQAAALQALHGSASRGGGLATLARRVRSGDAANIEAQAARRYWGILFGENPFRRRRDGDGPNPLLNYSYAVLRATMARALCAAGLHPSLGLQHHNRYDAFVLADDMMEPLRPVVDLAVAQIVAARGMEGELDREAKRALGEAMFGCVRIEGELRTVPDACGRMAATLAQVFLGKRAKICLPELDIPAEKRGREAASSETERSVPEEPA